MTYYVSSGTLNPTHSLALTLTLLSVLLVFVIITIYRLPVIACLFGLW